MFCYSKAMILGIDEVGRGPWAGPLVIGAVILGVEIDGITDSKKLTLKKRVELDQKIRERALAVSLGWVQPDEIDTLGLAAALELACKRAVEKIDTLGVAYAEIIIDGTINFLKNTPKGRFVTTMKKADLLVPSVGAASIIAKVARDNYMKEQAKTYPEYGFGSHVGYGTAAHQVAIKKYGVTPLHRLSFAPLAGYAPKSADIRESQSESKRTTKVIGNEAEEAAASYLVQNDYAIIDRNWRTKFCEIDIIARREETVYFVEVKYRKNDKAGDGLAMITAKKLRQMSFAAELYRTKRHVRGMQVQLAAIAVTGNPPVITDFIKVA